MGLRRTFESYGLPRGVLGAFWVDSGAIMMGYGFVYWRLLLYRYLGRGLLIVAGCFRRLGVLSYLVTVAMQDIYRPSANGLLFTTLTIIPSCLQDTIATKTHVITYHDAAYPSSPCIGHYHPPGSSSNRSQRSPHPSLPYLLHHEPSLPLPPMTRSRTSPNH